MNRITQRNASVPALPFMLVLELNLSQLDQFIQNLGQMPMPSILMRFDPGMEYKIMPSHLRFIFSRPSIRTGYLHASMTL
jgi:hypothetical protein